MTQINPAPAGRPVASPRSNVYTVLLIVAALALAAGIGYLWYRNGQLYPGTQPWEIAAPRALAPAPQLPLG